MSDATDNAMLGQAKGVNQNLGALVQAFTTAFPLHSSTGSFTMAAAANKVITDATIKAGSIVLLMPANAPAGALMAGANSLYVSARAAGASFTVATAGGGNAAGTETFEYLAVTTG
jgi:hypothetical protein